jgi:hypothetical protein
MAHQAEGAYREQACDAHQDGVCGQESTHKGGVSLAPYTT